jgi:hypothetical protein
LNALGKLLFSGVFTSYYRRVALLLFLEQTQLRDVRRDYGFSGLSHLHRVG